AFAHGRRDDPDAVVGYGEGGGSVTEGFGPGVAATLRDRVGRVEARRSVPGDRIRLGSLVALALARDDVQHGRTIELADAAQVEDELVDVVTVDRSDVAHAHRMERVVRGRVEEASRGLLRAAAQVCQRLPHSVERG